MAADMRCESKTVRASGLGALAASPSRLPLPALITVVKEVGVPRLPTLRGKKLARVTEVRIYTSENMNIDHNYIGLKGSPTRVVKIDYPKLSRAGRIIKVNGDDALDSAIEELLEYLVRRQLL
jgi:electron transfer flavoprotein beta subunit